MWKKCWLQKKIHFRFHTVVIPKSSCVVMPIYSHENFAEKNRERDWQLCVLLSKISLALELCGSSCKEKLLLALASLATGFLTSTLINIFITQLPLSTSLSHNCPYLNAQYACWLQSGLVSIWKLYIKNALHALHAFCHLLIHTLCFLDLGIPLAQPRAILWPWYLTLVTIEFIQVSGLYKFNQNFVPYESYCKNVHYVQCADLYIFR